MSVDKDLARNLLQINAIKLSPQKPFLWSSGLYSPIYCDNRIALSFPRTRNMIRNAFKNQIKIIPDVHLIAGVATSGIAFGAIVADALNIPFVYVRSKPKGHGRQNLIEGYWEENQNCIVIEDLLSTGGSALRAVEALRKEKLKVLRVYSIFTYMLKQLDQNFQSVNCSYTSLCNYEVLLTTAVDTGMISDKEESLLMAWKKNPAEWSKKYEEKLIKQLP